jgi:hypothetical protein
MEVVTAKKIQAVRKSIRHSQAGDEKNEHERDGKKIERRTACAGRATRVCRASAPACRGTRPCPAPAKRSPGDIDEGEKPGTAELQTHRNPKGAICHERARRGLARLRGSVNCATILERLGTGWALDKPESTRGALKFRRGPGEIVIVNHDGRGWFDPMSKAKGDIFSLVQHLEPALNFGQVRQRLRRVAGIAFRGVEKSWSSGCVWQIDRYL